MRFVAPLPDNLAYREWDHLARASSSQPSSPILINLELVAVISPSEIRSWTSISIRYSPGSRSSSGRSTARIAGPLPVETPSQANLGVSDGLLSPILRPSQQKALAIRDGSSARPIVSSTW